MKCDSRSDRGVRDKRNKWWYMRIANARSEAQSIKVSSSKLVQMVEVECDSQEYALSFR